MGIYIQPIHSQIPEWGPESKVQTYPRSDKQVVCVEGEQGLVEKPECGPGPTSFQSWTGVWTIGSHVVLVGLSPAEGQPALRRLPQTTSMCFSYPCGLDAGADP